MSTKELFKGDTKPLESLGKKESKPDLPAPAIKIAIKKKDVPSENLIKLMETKQVQEHPRVTKAKAISDISKEVTEMVRSNIKDILAEALANAIPKAPVEPPKATVEPPKAPVEPPKAPVEAHKAPVEPHKAPVEPAETILPSSLRYKNGRIF